jgi:hypothetical protein
VLVAAALCPGPPLLVAGMTGAEAPVQELRIAALAAVTELTAARPDVVAVVGTADVTRAWEPDLRLDFAVFAPATGAAAGAAAGAAGPPAGGSSELPTALGVGAWLLTAAGQVGRRLLQSVAAAEPAARCAEIGVALAASAPRVAILTMGEGSARRSLKAPGYLDERSAAFDAGVERAVRDGDLRGLLRTDAGLAADLMATGRPGWQVLAGAAGDRPAVTEIRYAGDPFGVAYLVASVRLP